MQTASAPADKAWLGRLLQPKKVHASGSVFYDASVADRLEKELSDQKGLSKYIIIYSESFLASLRAEMQLLAGANQRFDIVTYTADLIKTFAKLADRGERFVYGSKENRCDTLGKVMDQTFSDFVKKHGKRPTARELWDAIPDGNSIIQEKDDDRIWWLNSKGIEKNTSFKSFQARFTSFKKKFDKMKK